VLARARAIRSELDALRRDLSMLQGLQVGHATLGVVGTVSPWLVPPLVAEIARVAWDEIDLRDPERPRLRPRHTRVSRRVSG